MSTRPADGASRRVSPWACALVLVAATLVYGNTLWNQFPSDDATQVGDNLYIRSLGHVGDILTQPTWPGYVYRPLPTLTYAFTWALVGPEPWLYHLTSALLHAGVSVLVLLLLARFFGAPTALLGALLFAVHPIHVEAVASVANRTELLAALFGLAAVLLLVPASPPAESRARALLRSGCALACFVAALLAKESALTLAIAVPLLVAARTDDGVPLRERLRLVARGSLQPLEALALGAAVFFVVRRHVLGADVLSRAIIAPMDNPLVVLDPLPRVAHALVLLGRYLALCLSPWQLSADYSFGTSGLANHLWVPSALAWLALTGLLIAATVLGVARNSLRLAFAGLWFFGTFAVTSNVLFPIGTIFADRLAYVPSVAVCALAAWFLVERIRQPVRWYAAAAMIAIFSLLTLSYNRIWYDDATLFAYEMRTSPSAKVASAYGKVLLERGELAQARRQFRIALDSYPQHMVAAYGMALVEMQERRPEQARAWLERAIELDPTHGPSLVLLGRMRFADGEVDEAARLFVRALNSDSRSFDAKLGILAAMLARDNLGQARELRDELVSLAPQNAELAALSADLDQKLRERVSRQAADGAFALAGPG